MPPFEQLLALHRAPLERYIRFRIPLPDADDVLQNVLLAAYRAYPTLQDAARFKPWLIGIAHHKCADWLRRKYRTPEVPLADMRLSVSSPRFTWERDSLVERTLEQLPLTDQTVLRMCYFQQLPLSEMARRLGVPLGTVKSRLHTARGRFRAAWPIKTKGETIMKTIMPDFIPPYTITPRTDEPPFPVKWEEMMGWFIIPRLAEKLTWAMYDDPDGHRSEVDELCVTGRAVVHGVEGVEISVRTTDAMDCNQIDGETDVTRTFVAQLTDTHCRALAETHVENGVKQLYTFLDSGFMDNWGFGENNCGNETDLHVKGDILREGDVVRAVNKPFLLDVVGRYDVTIAGKTYDAICVMDLETYQEGMATEQYIDRSGRTVLWRRFNSDDWRLDRYGKPWSEMLPASPRISINGRTFVHWYDCITSHIL